MHKNEFIKQLARETSLPQKQVNQVVKSTIELIARSLRNGDKVVLTGFGTFEVRTRRERKGVNPQTKERIVIPETQTPGFTASNTLKNIVLGKAETSLLSSEFDSNHNEDEMPKQRRGRGRKNGA
ncbi:MAG: HU family DNA-binding protein [Chloroflexi bacterium]|uniref:HU family DNA-binding protein n=1 Tax=Candidatus Chlorohelix allophototropha TaxID=3003348 RepID=A0A8T7M216_9CHLR|nr:HU family DNA-binding protein [Chloroflexota bacterium]WJW66827.1 HU family DNA-binding protein [Chloroflexota bacterium L227-S17]